MFHHPLYVREAHFCKLCFSCLRLCRHESAKPYLSFPLGDLWRPGDLGVTLAPFALVVFSLTIVMLASHGAVAGTSTALGFTVAALGAVAVGLGLHIALPRLLSREGDRSLAARVAFALLVLAWGPFMAFHLGNIPGLDALQVRAMPGSFLAEHLPALRIPVLALLQGTAIGLAACLAGIALWRIRCRFSREGGRPVRLGWMALAACSAAYPAAALALVLSGGVGP